jgi:hypothetical protein
MKEEISNDQYLNPEHQTPGSSDMPAASGFNQEDPNREIWDAAEDDDPDGRYADIDREIREILDGPAPHTPQKQLGTALDNFSDRLNNRFDELDRRKKGIILLTVAFITFIIGMIYLYNLAMQFI